MARNVLSVVAMLLLIVSVSFGQQEAGDTELQISGTYFTTVGQDSKISNGFIQAKYGKFITDNFEIGIAPNISITSIDGGPFQESDTEVTIGGGAFLQYAFLTGDGKTVPYVGAQYFKSDLDNSDDNGSAGLNGGIKFFLTEKAALDFSGNYLWDLNDESEGGIVLLVGGISFLF